MLLSFFVLIPISMSFLYLIYLYYFSNFKSKPVYRTYRTIKKPLPNRYHKKPDWVIRTIISFKARMPNAGCRVLAASFNRQFGHKETVSKTWVNNVIKKYQYQITFEKRNIKNRKPWPVNTNRTWGVDMTGKQDLTGKKLQILAIIDHGSRFNLFLRAIHTKNSGHLIRIIDKTVNQYSRPQFIRTDNEAVFTGEPMIGSTGALGW